MIDLRPELCDMGGELADEGLAKAKQAQAASGYAAYQLVGEAKALTYAAQRILDFVRERA